MEKGVGNKQCLDVVFVAANISWNRCNTPSIICIVHDWDGRQMLVGKESTGLKSEILNYGVPSLMGSFLFVCMHVRKFKKKYQPPPPMPPSGSSSLSPLCMPMEERINGRRRRKRRRCTGGGGGE